VLADCRDRAEKEWLRQRAEWDKEDAERAAKESEEKAIGVWSCSSQSTKQRLLDNSQPTKEKLLERGKVICNNMFNSSAAAVAQMRKRQSRAGQLQLQLAS
jgi:kynurenine formamidase